MLNEEKDFLEYVSGEVDNLIDKICTIYKVDRAFYEFILNCNILDSNCNNILSRNTLIDDHDQFCRFCSTRTYTADNDGPICAECVGKITGED